MAAATFLRWRGGGDVGGGVEGEAAAAAHDGWLWWMERGWRAFIASCYRGVGFIVEEGFIIPRSIEEAQGEPGERSDASELQGNSEVSPSPTWHSTLASRHLRLVTTFG